MTTAGRLAASLLPILLFAGCQPVMTTNASAQESIPTNPGDAWPFKFKRHNFGMACYSTYGCRIRYGDHQINEPDDELSPSSESIGPDYRDNLSGGRLGIQNFPPPARVKWRSEDGSSHEAEVDIATIFENESILHNVARADVDPSTSVGTPEIILEVNDRTINVYMKTRIPTKQQQIPGNQYSFFRDDLILAYTRTY
jgi:hypothetical protein